MKGIGKIAKCGTHLIRANYCHTQLNHKTNLSHQVHSFHKHLLCSLCEGDLSDHLLVLLVSP